MYKNKLIDGIITEEAFQEILDEINQENGKITRIYPVSSDGYDYERIIYEVPDAQSKDPECELGRECKVISEDALPCGDCPGWENVTQVEFQSDIFSNPYESVHFGFYLDQDKDDILKKIFGHGPELDGAIWGCKVKLTIIKKQGD